METNGFLHLMPFLDPSRNTKPQNPYSTALYPSWMVEVMKLINNFKNFKQGRWTMFFEKFINF